jgi:hypothetical protein
VTSSRPRRIPDHLTVAEARDKVAELAREKNGVVCPTCGQQAKVYERSLTSVAARAIAALFTEHGREYGHMPTVARKHLSDVTNQGGYLVLGAHWDLIEELRVGDAVRRGYWRVTAKGEFWLKGLITIPCHVEIYNGDRRRPPYGEPLTVEKALGTHFNVFDLRRAVTPSLDDTDGALFPDTEAA